MPLARFSHCQVLSRNNISMEELASFYWVTRFWDSSMSYFFWLRLLVASSHSDLNSLHFLDFFVSCRVREWHFCSHSSSNKDWLCWKSSITPIRLSFRTDRLCTCLPLRVSVRAVLLTLRWSPRHSECKVWFFVAKSSSSEHFCSRDFVSLFTVEFYSLIVRFFTSRLVFMVWNSSVGTSVSI
jgi:hypothetical protein